MAGWLYGTEIKELVRTVTGLVPGRRDGFLSQFMKARKSVYRRLHKDDRAILEDIARRWSKRGPPNYVKKKYVVNSNVLPCVGLTGNRQFQSKFSKAAAAFVNMCLREYGIWPIIFYCGLPGMGIHANMSELCPRHRDNYLRPTSFEALQVKSIARRGLRDWANVEEVLDIIHDYVHESSGACQICSDVQDLGLGFGVPQDMARRA